MSQSVSQWVTDKHCQWSDSGPIKTRWAQNFKDEWCLLRQLLFKLCIFFFSSTAPSMIHLFPKYDFVFHSVWPSETQHNISFTGLTPEKQFLILKNWNITAVQLSRKNIFARLPEISQNSEFWNYYKKILWFVWGILNISKLFPTINAFVISKLFFLLRQNQISSSEKKMS